MTCINFMTGFEMLGDPAKCWTSVVIFAIENPIDLSCCDSGIGSTKTSYRRLIHDPNVGVSGSSWQRRGEEGRLVLK